MGGLSERRRNRVIARLQRGYASGALSTQTFERRLDCALRAESPNGLRAAVRPAAVRRASSGLLVGLAADGAAVIGRSSSCDLVLHNDSVSRRHAIITRQGEKYILTDLGSTNATYVNGRQISECEVVPGDSVQLGEILLSPRIRAGDVPFDPHHPRAARLLGRFDRGAYYLVDDYGGRTCLVQDDPRSSVGWVCGPTKNFRRSPRSIGSLVKIGHSVRGHPVAHWLTGFYVPAGYSYVRYPGAQPVRSSALRGNLVVLESAVATIVEFDGPTVAPNRTTIEAPPAPDHLVWR